MQSLLGRVAAACPKAEVEVSTGQGNTVPVLTEAARGTRPLVVGAHRRRGPLAVGASHVVDGFVAHCPW
jgi:hypothetical protein